MDLQWNVESKKTFLTGLDRGVLFLMDSNGDYPAGVAWEGLMSITESPGGAEPTDLYANNAKYATLQSAETFGGTIEAYTYPDEFAQCDGSVQPTAGVKVTQQARATFGMAYRTKIGSDADGMDTHYELHLVYGCKIQPSEVSLSSINDSPEAGSLSWEFTTTPAAVTGHNPTSRIIIDTRTAPADFITWLEKQLYGDSPNNDPNLPLPDAVLTNAASPPAP